MQAPNENKADSPQAATPPLGRTPSEHQRVRKEQQGAVQFCARLGRSPTETQDMLSTAYQQDALRKTVTKTYHKRFENLGVDVYKSNTKAKKSKTTGDKKPSTNELKSEENGKAPETGNGEQEKMNVDEGGEDQNTSNGSSNNVEVKQQPQSESVPQEAKKDSPDATDQSSDSSQVNKTSEEGSTEKKVEGAAEA